MKDNQFLQQVEGCLGQDRYQAFLNSSRDLAIPSKKLESWRYFPSQQLELKQPAKELWSSQQLASWVEKKRQPGMDLLVFYGGRIQPQWTSDSIEYREIPVVNFDFAKLDSKLDAFSLYAAQSNWLVHPKTSCRQLQILHLGSAGQSFSNLQISLQVGQEISVLESFCLEEGATYHSVFEWVQAQRSQLHYHSLTEMPATAQLYLSGNLYLEQEAKFYSHVLDTEAGRVRRRMQVNLLGRLAEADLKGFYLLKDRGISNHKVDVMHYVGEAVSKQHYKGILDGEAKAIFDGKVFVDKQAMGTDSQQLNQTMLFKDTAEVISRPQLEIYADDVSCAHGATIGGFNPEEVFYFQSRAIPQDTALRMLAIGYAQEVFADIELPGIQELFTQQFLQRFSGFEVNLDVF